MENRIYHGDTEGTEFHGEKEESESLKDLCQYAPISVQLRALRVSVVTLCSYHNLP
jgi:hypothetical protein